jgi:hypothetical protein
MTRLVGMVMGLILIQPAGATADASAQQADSPGTVVDRRVLMEPLEPTVAFGPLSAEPQQKTAPPPPSDRPRRRGSMVGYIDNPILESKVRIRFDHATQNTVPDRAEYFYAKCGCYQGLSGHPVVGVRALADGQAPGPGPTIVTDLSFQQLYLEGEYAHTPRFSLFAEVPLRWIQPQAFAGPDQFGDVQSEAFGPPSAGGIGDVRAGVKYGLVATPEQSLTVQLRAFLPTGSAVRGLGTDHASLEPAFLLYHAADRRGTGCRRRTRRSGHVARDDAAGADHARDRRSVTPGQDDRAAADPDVRSDLDRLAVLLLAACAARRRAGASPCRSAPPGRTA